MLSKTVEFYLDDNLSDRHFPRQIKSGNPELHELSVFSGTKYLTIVRSPLNSCPTQVFNGELVSGSTRKIALLKNEQKVVISVQCPDKEPKGFTVNVIKEIMWESAQIVRIGEWELGERKELTNSRKGEFYKYATIPEAHFAIQEMVDTKNENVLPNYFIFYRILKFGERDVELEPYKVKAFTKNGVPKYKVKIIGVEKGKATYNNLAAKFLSSIGIP